MQEYFSPTGLQQESLDPTEFLPLFNPFKKPPTLCGLVTLMRQIYFRHLPKYFPALNPLLAPLFA